MYNTEILIGNEASPERSYTTPSFGNGEQTEISFSLCIPKIRLKEKKW